MKKYLVVTLQFEGIHSWPTCPFEELNFLRDPHRHIFHVKATKEVSHNDRDIEIIMLKREMEKYSCDRKAGVPVRLGAKSCEDVAEQLIKKFDLHSCEVLEDGENGAFISK